MALIPDNTNTTLYKLRAIRHAGRRGKTVAMGTIGEECRRKLWFNFHWVTPVEEIDSRLRNLFDTGTRAEDFIIRDLEAIGIEVTLRQEELWGFAKHAHGFTDGRCINVPEAPKTEHLLEIKTHNDKSFQELVKKGVKVSKPDHYAQVHRYMIATKLKRCLYVAYNKNNSEYYIERIRYDKGFAEDLLRKEYDIIVENDVPERKFEKSWFKCKWCDYNPICYEKQDLDRNCRTCKMSDRKDDGVWVCTGPGNGADIPLDLQEVGCDQYQSIIYVR